MSSLKIFVEMDRSEANKLEEAAEEVERGDFLNLISFPSLRNLNSKENDHKSAIN